MASGASRSAAKRREKKTTAAEAAAAEAAPASKPELFDATRYDFERLEAAVTDLVDRHRALQRENSALRQEIAERAARAQQLEAEVDELRSRRERSRARLDKMLADLGQMEVALSGPSAGKKPKARTKKQRTAAVAKKRKTPQGG
ncbi:MAG: cell division protein ZapB [Myxococcota bacterium]|nr:cell division protein ZapB [Myxococcota bacterium]